MMTIQLDPVRASLECGVHPEWNARNVRADYLPDGRIWARCTFKDDSPLVSHRARHSDFPIARLLDNETDLRTWSRSLYYLLEELKKVEQTQGPCLR